MANIPLRSVARIDYHQINGVPQIISPSRTPTLEANLPEESQKNVARQSVLRLHPQQLRQWFESQLKHEAIPIDDAEELIKETIEHSTKDYNRRILRHLLSDYAWFKDKQGHKVVVDLIQTWLFRDGTDANNIKSQVDAFSVQPTATFSSFTTELLEHLSNRPPNSLRVIALAERANPAHDNTFLTARHKVWATVRTRLRTLPFVPGDIIKTLVNEALGLPLIVQSASAPSILDARRKALALPTKRRPLANFDPDQLDNDHILLTWERHAPHFEHDIDIYMREPHRTLSPSIRAEMRLWRRPSASSSPNENVIVISFDHYNSLQSFTMMRGQLTQNQAGASSPGQIWCIESETLLSIYALIEVVVLDTVNFLQECSVELELMNVRARTSPTSNKIRYLLHLNDRRSMASAAINHAARVLHIIRKWKGAQQDVSQIWDAGLAWSKRATSLNDELGFLRRQLQKLETEIKELHQVLRERLELGHNRRDFLLTVVAAIYLPLSFATSFFGMNINTATPPTEKGFSNYTSDWIAHSPIDYRNTTKALVSTIGTSSSMTFSWRTFGITAGSLVLTLPLSLTLGTMVRSLYQSAVRYARYWRIVAIPCFAGFVFLSAFGGYIWSDDDILFSNLTWIAGIICNILFALYAYVAAYGAWRKEAVGDTTAKPLYWTLMSVMITACLIGSQVSDFYFWFLTAFPWLIVCVRWLVSWLVTRRRTKNK